MGKPRIFLHDKIYIPVTEVSEKRVVKEYTHYEFDDNICRGCPMRHQRPCADCRECEWGGLKTSFLLANRKTNNGKAYYTIPMGDFENVERKLRIDFDDFKVIDRTKRIPFDYPIKFTSELYDYQEDPVKRIKRFKMGILKSKPRTGKTVMAVASMCKLGLRTIIMADQKDFLDGFYETIEQMTNLPALEEKTGRKLFGFPKKLEDFENFQVVLVTYQSLIKNTSVCKKRLKALRKNYGALFVDEVHRTCAPEFTKVLGKMTTRVRIGLSATPRRKEKREILAYPTIGPVIAKPDADVMKPEISVHYSPESVRSNNQFSGQAGWTKFCQFLAKHEDRNMSIVQRVIADLKAGRNVVIPIMFKDHAAKLKREIDFAWGDEICATFLGGSKNSKLRKSIVDNARSGKIRCVIGIRRLVQIGINVPQWDTLYYVMPMNNAPNWEQESYRILTPLKDKKQPMIRMFVDRYMMRSLGCFKSTLQTSMRFGHALRPKTQKVLDNDFGRSFYTPTKNSYEKPERERSIMGRTF